MTTLLAKGCCCIVVLMLFSGCSSFQEVKPESEMSGLCAPEQGPPFSYRKKVAVLAANVRDPQSDLPALDVAWSNTLQKRLSDSGRLIVVDASDQHILSGDLQRQWIIDLAKQLDVQFVIAVTFHNLHASRTQIGKGLYAIKLPQTQRQVDVELIVFDGYTGTKMASFFHATRAEGWRRDVVNPAHQPVLRGKFFDSPLGEAMASVLASQVEDGVNRLACLPLMGRVIKVSGRDIHISVGGNSLIRPGDTLQLFRRHGMIENRVGPVEIVRIFPESVIGIFRGEDETPGLSQGLFVRAW